MKTLEQAAQQALDALEPIHHGNMTPMAENAWKTAITALREALSGVQALSAGPEAFLKGVIALCSHRGYSPANIEAWDKDDKWVADLWRQAEAMLAASTTPPAEQQAQPGAVDRTGCTAGTDKVCTRRGCATSCPAQQAAPKTAPGVGNSGFDHKTAADFLSGKTVSDEAVRKFVAASRWAHDEKASLSAMLISVRGELASREAEIALLKKALLEAEAAPQQEAQEPVAWLNPWRADQVTTDYDAYGERGIPLYTAPQPAPAPLSDDVVKDAARYRWLRATTNYVTSNGKRIDVRNMPEKWDAAIDAALAAQGGK